MGHQSCRSQARIESLDCSFAWLSPLRAQRLVLGLGSCGIGWPVAVLVTCWDSHSGVLCPLDSGRPGSNETLHPGEEGVGEYGPGQAPHSPRSRRRQRLHPWAVVTKYGTARVSLATLSKHVPHPGGRAWGCAAENCFPLILPSETWSPSPHAGGRAAWAGVCPGRMWRGTGTLRQDGGSGPPMPCCHRSVTAALQGFAPSQGWEVPGHPLGFQHLPWRGPLLPLPQVT